MTVRALKAVLTMVLLVWLPVDLRAESSRSQPVFKTWSADCTNSGLCFTSSFIRAQNLWLDLRLVNNWEVSASPLIRLTTNSALREDGVIRLSIDGTIVEELPVAQLREIQASVAAPVGFRPIGGEGFWYPTGPATRTLIDMMNSGRELTVELPVDPDPVTVPVALDGFRESLRWIDRRQERMGSTAALVEPGSDTAVDAPHAMPILDTAGLPPAVAERWDNGRFCSDIDPAIFAGLDAVSAPLPDNAALFILPCGAPGAYNTPYVVMLVHADGKVRQLSFARMTELGPVAIDLVYNARWNPKTRQLDSLLKGSGVGECGIWNRWQWNGTAFALIEEAARSTCDGQAVELEKWPTTWPVSSASE
ncbi:MAG: DUF1176 domain-containing protein [Roseibium sp.]|nr:DUF1176 domain-containing protein [Roseibium sp.]